MEGGGFVFQKDVLIGQLWNNIRNKNGTSWKDRSGTSAVVDGDWASAGTYLPGQTPSYVRLWMLIRTGGCNNASGDTSNTNKGAQSTMNPSHEHVSSAVTSNAHSRVWSSTKILFSLGLLAIITIIAQAALAELASY